MCAVAEAGNFPFYKRIQLDLPFREIDPVNSIAFSGFVLPAFFQTDNPIYASKAVRIRLGHSKLPPGEESFVTDENENRKATADENYVWTYTSPEFPMLPVS